MDFDRFVTATNKEHFRNEAREDKLLEQRESQTT